MELPDEIVEQFCKGNRLNCRNVEEVIEQLNKLPSNLKTEIGFGKGVDLVIFNYGQPDMHLSFEEAGDSNEFETLYGMFKPWYIFAIYRR